MDDNDYKENFKESLFSAIEHLIDHPLSNSGRKLVQNYFNSSKGALTFDRALDAIVRYTQEEIPPFEEMPAYIRERINELAYWAKKWDAE